MSHYKVTEAEMTRSGEELLRHEASSSIPRPDFPGDVLSFGSGRSKEVRESPFICQKVTDPDGVNTWRAPMMEVRKGEPVRSIKVLRFNKDVELRKAENAWRPTESWTVVSRKKRGQKCSAHPDVPVNLHLKDQNKVVRKQKLPTSQLSSTPSIPASSAAVSPIPPPQGVGAQPGRSTAAPRPRPVAPQTHNRASPLGRSAPSSALLDSISRDVKASESLGSESSEQDKPCEEQLRLAVQMDTEPAVETEPAEESRSQHAVDRDPEFPVVPEAELGIESESEAEVKIESELAIESESDLAAESELVAGIDSEEAKEIESETILLKIAELEEGISTAHLIKKDEHPLDSDSTLPLIEKYSSVGNMSHYKVTEAEMTRSREELLRHEACSSIPRPDFPGDVLSFGSGRSKEVRESPFICQKVTDPDGVNTWRAPMMEVRKGEPVRSIKVLRFNKDVELRKAENAWRPTESWTVVSRKKRGQKCSAHPDVPVNLHLKDQNKVVRKQKLPTSQLSSTPSIPASSAAVSPIPPPQGVGAQPGRSTAAPRPRPVAPQTHNRASPLGRSAPSSALLDSISRDVKASESLGSESSEQDKPCEEQLRLAVQMDTEPAVETEPAEESRSQHAVDRDPEFPVVPEAELGVESESEAEVKIESELAIESESDLAAESELVAGIDSEEAKEIESETILLKIAELEEGISTAHLIKKDEHPLDSDSTLPLIEKYSSVGNMSHYKVTEAGMTRSGEELLRHEASSSIPQPDFPGDVLSFGSWRSKEVRESPFFCQKVTDPDGVNTWRAPMMEVRRGEPVRNIKVLRFNKDVELRKAENAWRPTESWTVVSRKKRGQKCSAHPDVPVNLHLKDQNKVVRKQKLPTSQLSSTPSIPASSAAVSPIPPPQGVGAQPGRSTAASRPRPVAPQTHNRASPLGRSAPSSALLDSISRDVKVRSGEPVRNIKVLTFNKDVELRKAENARSPSVRKVKEDRDLEESVTQELLCQMRSRLNKLTPESFERLMAQIKELSINTLARLDGIGKMVLEKAICETKFASTYAKMCCELKELAVPVCDYLMPLDFHAVILDLCQVEFWKVTGDGAVLEREWKDHCAAKGEDRQSLLQLEAKVTAHRKRAVGSMKFTGELFKLGMVKDGVILEYVTELLDTKTEEAMECLCCLITTTGSILDSEQLKPEMDRHFSRIESIREERKLASRVCFKLQDLMDLRQNNWVLRREEQGTKTIDQIHKEVEKESQLATEEGVSKQLLSKTVESRNTTPEKIAELEEGISTAHQIKKDEHPLDSDSTLPLIEKYSSVGNMSHYKVTEAEMTRSGEELLRHEASSSIPRPDFPGDVLSFGSGRSKEVRESPFICQKVTDPDGVNTWRAPMMEVRKGEPVRSIKVLRFNKDVELRKAENAWRPTESWTVVSRKKRGQKCSVLSVKIDSELAIESESDLAAESELVAGIDSEEAKEIESETILLASESHGSESSEQDEPCEEQLRLETEPAVETEPAEESRSEHAVDREPELPVVPEAELGVESESEAEVKIESELAFESESDLVAESELVAGIDSEEAKEIESETILLASESLGSESSEQDKPCEEQLRLAVEMDTEPAVEAEPAEESLSEHAVDCDQEFPMVPEAELGVEPESETEEKIELELAIESESDLAEESELVAGIDSEEAKEIESETILLASESHGSEFSEQDEPCEEQLRLETEPAVETEPAEESRSEHAVDREPELPVVPEAELGVESESEAEVKIESELAFESELDLVAESELVAGIDSEEAKEIESETVLLASESLGSESSEQDKPCEEQLRLAVQMDTEPAVEAEPAEESLSEHAVDCDQEFPMVTEAELGVESESETEDKIELELAIESESDLAAESELVAGIDSEEEKEIESETILLASESHGSESSEQDEPCEEQLRLETEPAVETEPAEESRSEHAVDREPELPVVPEAELGVESESEAEVKIESELAFESESDLVAESELVAGIDSEEAKEIESETILLASESLGSESSEQDKPCEEQLRLAVEMDTEPAVEAEPAEESLSEHAVDCDQEFPMVPEAELGVEPESETEEKIELELAIESESDLAEESELVAGIDSEEAKEIESETILLIPNTETQGAVHDVTFCVDSEHQMAPERTEFNPAMELARECFMSYCTAILLEGHEEEETLELLCRLLSTIGRKMDSDRAKCLLDKWMHQLEDILKEGKASNRIRLIIQDIMDQRQNNWAPRDGNQESKATSQVHKDAELENQQEGGIVEQQRTCKEHNTQNRGVKQYRGEHQGNDRPQRWANRAHQGQNRQSGSNERHPAHEIDQRWNYGEHNSYDQDQRWNRREHQGCTQGQRWDYEEHRGRAQDQRQYRGEQYYQGQHEGLHHREHQGRAQDQRQYRGEQYYQGQHEGSHHREHQGRAQDQRPYHGEQYYQGQHEGLHHREHQGRAQDQRQYHGEQYHQGQHEGLHHREHQGRAQDQEWHHWEHHGRVQNQRPYHGRHQGCAQEQRWDHKGFARV